MGRKRRHNAKTGDGGGEIRARKKIVKEAERNRSDAERIDFYNDPSDDENKSHDGSFGSPSEDEHELIGLGEDEESEQFESENEKIKEFDSDSNCEDFEDEKRKIREMHGKWGKSKKNFYSADTAEYELESDEEAAKDEEDAALELQKKEAALMDEDDFEFEEHADDVDSSDVRPTHRDQLVANELAGIPLLGETSGQSLVEHLGKDFSKMSKKEKLEIVNQ
jgi:U3 small nucleolar RNA-associated protein 3